MTDKEIYSLNIQDAMTLECLGIKTEDIQVKDESAIYKFTVPEKSITDQNELSSNELIQLYKETIIKMNTRQIFDSEEDMDEWDIAFFNSYHKFYCKIRKGDIWTQNDVSTTLSLLKKGIEALAEYKQV